ncbi:hypothetical protein CA606_18055 [Caulobacter vibrioides]|uniref:Uncharacterized protein n=1 Tax=Caulobacter vibrioides TaxID=155892 RepID=A0A290MQ07_CAUVI|nr:VVA0879 family protein [Caulobacter vibrioides]ATC34079.1 hypothetical protein CA606_18055 [Caulobacter vibrioides]
MAEVITVQELHARFKAQDVGERRFIAMKCPICGTVQNMQSLLTAGAGETEDQVERYIGFSCVGRWTNAGPHKRGEPPGRGCDWTLGGLFKLHKLEVVNARGRREPYFEIATQEEAKALQAQQEAPAHG